MRTFIARSDVFLRERGIKASFQRVKIFDYLQHSQEHPSVSKIFQDLNPHIPSLSRATVYNTINLFVEKKLVIPIQVEGPESRYDLADPTHTHFHCTVCARIFDLDADPPAAPAELRGFRVEKSQVIYSGVCPECLAKSAKA
ncbi:MAG: transcriptional repressor [Spirochaetales bacterium]|nr:transcriptional repressor [Spirochaetales bacterium]